MQVVRNAGRTDAEILRHDVERLRGRLQDLERTAHGLEASAAALRKVHRLEALLSNLERAADGADPAGALPWSGRRSAPGLRAPHLENLVPANDDCADAFDVHPGETVSGDTSEATQDGQASCGSSLFSGDVWFKYVPQESAAVHVDSFGSGYDTVLSVHTGCPGTLDNEIRCNDDAFGLQSETSFYAYPGDEYWIRLSGVDQAAGPYELHLGFGGEISGTVTSAENGASLAGGVVRVWNSDGYYVRSASTGDSGEYSAGGLDADAYFLSTRYFEGFFDELYDDLPCPEGSCEVTDGTAVPVVSNSTVEDIDFALDEGGAVTGTVTDAVTGEPVTGVRIEIWDDEGGNYPAGADYTDEHGDYRVGGLVAGTYFASAESSGHRSELYDDIPCLGEIPYDCDPATGTPIAVRNPQTTAGIDFALERLGTIAGTVTDAGTGEPLAGVRVAILSPGGYRVGYDYTGEDGTYLVGGLPPGTYLAVAESYSHEDELYDDVPCPGGLPYGDCDPADGTPLTVELNTEISGIDFALDRLGSIAGTLTDAVTGEPIAGIWVEVHTVSGSWVGADATDDAGHYLVGNLDPDDYLVAADPYGGYLPELYDDVPCPDGIFYGCDPADGTPVAVALDTTTGSIDFTLDRLGSIAGTATDAATGEPRDGVRMEIYRLGEAYRVAYDYTDETGGYRVEDLGPDTYFVTAESDEFADELYDDVPCPGGIPYGCEQADGTPLAVELNATTDGIDFALDRFGSIAGTVTDAATGEPLDGVRMEIYRLGESYQVAHDFTDETGRYRVENLEPDTYFVTAESDEFGDELYDDVPCPRGLPYGCEQADGTPLAVELNATTDGIDFALDRFGSIAGTVTDAATGEPIPYITVEVRNGGGSQVSSASTDGSGDYTVVGLAAGTYFARTSNSGDYVDELYDDLPCFPGCDPTAGRPIAVSLGATTAGIDFALDLGGVIAGTVSDALTGDPISGRVRIWTAGGSYLGADYIDSTGQYAVEGLGTGTYFAATDVYDYDYVDEVYDDIPCPSGCDPTAGRPIAVTVGATTAGIDFALGHRGAISSTVVDGATGDPLTSMRVEIWIEGMGYPIGSCWTGADGTCTVAGLYPGTYYAATDDSTDYLDELYDDRPCLYGPPQGCDPTKGTPIAVTVDSTRDIDFALIPFDSGIAGTVADESGEPIAGVTIDAWDAAGGHVASTVTLADGEYFLRIDAGAYTVSTDNEAGYVEEIFDDVLCPLGSAADGLCDPLLGTPITVTASGAQMIAPGIDFVLVPLGSLIFNDGFEAGDLSAWPAAVGGPG
jgi:5-hydroxyisourate hydrolase-like protein (transthyretin family)